MERTHSPHDIAFIPGNPGGLHHFAFWLDSWSEIGRAADIIVPRRLDIDAGPTRHGITRGHTIYFFDPSGNRNEVFTGGYWADPKMEPITWTADKLWAGHLLLGPDGEGLLRRKLYISGRAAARPPIPFSERSRCAGSALLTRARSYARRHSL